MSWSRWHGEDCIRIEDARVDAEVRVRAGPIRAGGEYPSMAGRVVRDGDAVCFVPRFPFVDGATYTVVVDGDVRDVLERPRSAGAPIAEVEHIWPSSISVPRNLLRIYIDFSERMSEGYAAHCVRLVDDAGVTMAAALLPTEHELWDSERRRLTVLLDPARIKRGLAGHRALGYPLQTGGAFRVVVDAAFCDARGRPLRSGADRRYAVDDDKRRRVDPHHWTITEPRAATREPIDVDFDAPLDHGLLAGCLHVVDANGRAIDGVATIGHAEQSWHFTPHAAWGAGLHHLVVDPILEDQAGNSVCRVFDRDLTRPEDDPIVGSPVMLSFSPAAVGV